MASGMVLILEQNSGRQRGKCLLGVQVHVVSMAVPWADEPGAVFCSRSAAQG